MAARLKLRAEDAEDVAVLSAVLQDALVTVAEMVYDREEQRFILIANRFRWEPGAEGPERILAGLRVDAVTAVQRRGFHPRDTDRLLALLAIRNEDGSLYLDFAGGSSIRLDVERVLCHLDDIGEAWPTRWRPSHPLDETV